MRVELALDSGYEVRTLKEIPDHRDIRTTRIYTVVLRQNSYALRSPADCVSTEAIPGHTLFDVGVTKSACESE